MSASAVSLDKLMAFLALTNGKDKLAKLIQYSARFYSWYLSSYTGNKDLAAKLLNLFKAAANSRRIFRIGNELALVQKLQTFSPAKISDHFELLQLLQQVGMAVYFFWDHLIWLAANGIIAKDNMESHKRISNWGWFLGLVFGAVWNSLKLLEGVEKEKKLLAKTEKDSKELEAIRNQRKTYTIAYLRYFGDMLIAASGAEITTFNDGVLGAAGTVAALEGFYNGWPAK